MENVNLFFQNIFYYVLLGCFLGLAAGIAVYLGLKWLGCFKLNFPFFRAIAWLLPVYYVLIFVVAGGLVIGFWRLEKQTSEIVSRHKILQQAISSVDPALKYLETMPQIRIVKGEVSNYITVLIEKAIQHYFKVSEKEPLTLTMRIKKYLAKQLSDYLIREIKRQALADRKKTAPKSEPKEKLLRKELMDTAKDYENYIITAVEKLALIAYKWTFLISLTLLILPIIIIRFLGLFAKEKKA